MHGRYATRLRVERTKIGDKIGESIQVITNQTESGVAVVTQQPANLVCLMVVVDAQPVG